MSHKIEILKYESVFKKDLYTYLHTNSLIDAKLPECPDLETLWEKICEAYLPDAIREYQDYPTVALGWIMYVGMAMAKYWDKDWEVYGKVENLYVYLRDKDGYDKMDDYIKSKVLMLNDDESKALEEWVGRCASRTYSQLRRMPIEAGTHDAFYSFIAALHQLYLFGIAIQLKKMGYRMVPMD